jgi:tetratricopeptide (TPR) repeat protein
MRISQPITAVRRFVLAGLASAGLGSVAAATEILELDWTEVETEHFTIATPVPRDDALRLAEELENFRTLALLQLGAVKERVPTKIFILPQTLPEFGLNNRVAGYFAAGLRGNYIVMEIAGGTTTLKHEYAHFLVYSLNSQIYPPWLEEGLAELLSTLRVRDGVLEYGRTAPERLSELGWRYDHWLHFDSILEQRDIYSVPARDLSLFYAQSWLLTQYLAVGRADATGLSGQVEDFLRRVEAGADDKTAFLEAFGIRVNQLETRLLAYARRQIRYQTAPLGQSLPPVTLSARPMARDRVAAELALMLFESRNEETGIHYCERALELNPENSLAAICSAEPLFVAERFDEAEVVFRRALEVDPANPAREIDYGAYFLKRAMAESDAANASERVAPLLAEARRRFERVYVANRDNAEALFLHGLTYLVDENDAAKAVASLEAAHELMPGHVDTQIALAQAYIASGEGERARLILRRLLAWSRPDYAAGIREMLASIDSSAGTE